MTARLHAQTLHCQERQALKMELDQKTRELVQATWILSHERAVRELVQDGA